MKSLGSIALSVLVVASFFFSCGTPPEEEPPMPAAVREISTARSSIVLQPGETTALRITVEPPEADYTLSFRSSQSEVVHVDAEGVLTARQSGTVNLTVTAESPGVITDEGKQTAEVKVIVKDVRKTDALLVNMVQVPDQVPETGEPFWLQDTPVTYAQWQIVYRWAVQDRGDGKRSDGGPLYTIPSTGRRGNDGGEDASDQHPVTRVSWRSAMLWLNALTEYYNAHTDSALEPVYYTDADADTPMRTGTRDESIRRDVFFSQDNPYFKKDADGFRLPYDQEWVIAAGYSGTGSLNDLAVFRGNSDGGTAPAASKPANQLGLYDISGNVAEWVYNWHPEYIGHYRILRGGSWASPAAELLPSERDFDPPFLESGMNGFRAARTAVRIPVERVEIDRDELVLPIGSEDQLQAEVYPRNANNLGVIWRSSNPDVLSVAQDGRVLAQRVGKAEVTVTTEDGSKTATAVVQIQVPVEGIRVLGQSEALAIDETRQLSVQLIPENATNRAVSWRSDDESIATVNQNGHITGVSSGTVRIYVSSDSTDLTSFYTAVVKGPVQIDVGLVNMVQIPAGEFPAGLDDDRVAAVPHDFWLADTEITYAVWNAVYSAAESLGYIFTSEGREGGYWPDTAAVSADHPVTEVDWPSAVVWANAFTELYNQQNDGNLRFVYYANPEMNKPIRNAHELESRGRHGMYIDATAAGFRLPYADEWELAARYKGGDSTGGSVEFPDGSGHYWVPGNYAAGAAGSVNDSDATRQVAVVPGVPGSTEEVASRQPNQLVLYDMSGNIAEWVLKASETAGDSTVPVHRGGSYFDDLSAQRVSRLVQKDDDVGLLGFSAGLRLARGTAGGSFWSAGESTVEPEPAETESVRDRSRPTQAASSGENGQPADATQPAGKATSYNLDAVSFNMSPFKDIYIGRTEVTYGLWNEVYDWAQSNGYSIPDSGDMHFSASSDDYPVSRISWRSAVVWMNALTEYVNSRTDASLTPVYYSDANYEQAIRSADNESGIRSDPGEIDNPYVRAGADGFRLPGSQEWESAARYQTAADGLVSGATAVPETEADLHRFAVFNQNSPSAVGSAEPNALGLFDMSGNVEELCFDWHPMADNRRRVRRGGSFRSTLDGIALGQISSVAPSDNIYSATGVRVVRNRGRDTGVQD